MFWMFHSKRSMTMVGKIQKGERDLTSFGMRHNLEHNESNNGFSAYVCDQVFSASSFYQLSIMWLILPSADSVEIQKVILFQKYLKNSFCITLVLIKVYILLYKCNFTIIKRWLHGSCIGVITYLRPTMCLCKQHTPTKARLAKSM